MPNAGSEPWNAYVHIQTDIIYIPMWLSWPSQQPSDQGEPGDNGALSAFVKETSL